MLNGTSCLSICVIILSTSSSIGYSVERFCLKAYRLSKQSLELLKYAYITDYKLFSLTLLK